MYIYIICVKNIYYCLSTRINVNISNSYLYHKPDLEIYEHIHIYIKILVP